MPSERTQLYSCTFIAGDIRNELEAPTLTSNIFGGAVRRSKIGDSSDICNNHETAASGRLLDSNPNHWSSRKIIGSNALQSSESGCGRIECCMMAAVILEYEA